MWFWEGEIFILFVPALRGVLKLEPLKAGEVGWCLLAAVVSVGWLEVWKGSGGILGEHSVRTCDPCDI